MNFNVWKIQNQVKVFILATVILVAELVTWHSETSGIYKIQPEGAYYQTFQIAQ